MDVRYVADLGERRFCAVDRVIDWKKMCGWELADPVDVEDLATLRLNRGARPGAVVSPYCCGRQIPMNLLSELEHFDLDNFTGLVCGANYRRDGE
jgi:hypothetical protein